MSDPFTDRLREATLEVDEAHARTLAAAVAGSSKHLSPDRCLSLVRLAFRREVDPGLEADFRARLNGAGARVVRDYGERQLVATLAACCLVDAFGRHKVAAAQIAAFASRCASNLQWEAVHPDVSRCAEQYLMDRAVFVRLSATDAGRRVQHDIADDLKALKRRVERSEELAGESGDAAWWLLDGAHAETALSAALDLQRFVRVLPPPFASHQLLQAKLQRERVTAESGVPQRVTIPNIAPEISEFCPNLSAGETGDRDPRTAQMLFDELTLVRAYATAKGSR